MRRLLVLSAVFFVQLSLFAQKDDVLLTINKVPVKTSEFKQVYEKNLDLVKDKEAKDIDKNLELFIDYKLKVLEAYNLKLDTARAYKQEFNSYKNQLIAPYLRDDNLQENLIKEAYDRTKQEVRASHILVRYPKRGKKIDTLALYKKISDIRTRIIEGESFDKVAREASEDPSAKINAGDLGYFSAFKMVYPFENAAYTTKKGEVSKPFKTRFGYHIVKVTDKRLSKGEFEVAHILASDKSIGGKVRIDSAYQDLQNKKSFASVAKKYSDDVGTASKGGKLSRFGTGVMVKEFEDAVLSLKNKGDYSKPFKTRYGWHIVKLIKKHPVQPFEELKPVLLEKIKRGERGSLSRNSVLNKLKTEYTISTNQKALALFKNSKTRVFENDLTDVLLTINDKKITQNEFAKYIKRKKHVNINKLFDEFKDKEVLTYFKENLESTNKDFKFTLQEYRDGLLLFELLQQKIWNASIKDTEGLKEYFNKNKSKYKVDDLSKVKGEVMSHYQKYLEDTWVKELRAKNRIKIKKRALKKLKKVYKQ